MIYLCFDFQSAPLEKLLSVIPKNERLRISRIENRDKQLQSAAAWALLSKVENLNEYTETARDSDGKPYIPCVKRFFSLSHCETCVAVAISDEPVGIDVEQIKDTYPEAVASRIFPKKTQEEIANANDSVREFYIKWTQYESFIKVLGSDAGFSIADSSLFHSEVINGAAVSLCCGISHEIKIIPVSDLLNLCT